VIGTQKTGNLMRGYAYKGRPTAIRTKHDYRIKAALLGLEAACGFRPVETYDEPAPNSGPITNPRPIESLEMHVDKIHVQPSRC
jgi:hypothetical protein